VADSAALRMRRSRRHAQGDHELCKHGPLGEDEEVAALLEAVKAEWDDHDPLSNSITLDTYGHLFPDELDQLAERLEDLRSRALAARAGGEVSPQRRPAVVARRRPCQTRR